MPTTVTAFLPPTDEERIRAFEQRNGLTLPEDYRQFLLRHNGGRPEPAGSVIPELKEPILVGDFFGLTEDGSLSLQSYLDEYRDEMPDGWMVIATDPGAAFFVLGTRPPHVGVYFWDHQHFFSSSSEEENAYRLADSFQSWIDSLREFEEVQ
jgi:SMI1/KNR4 family protein SUKH-1